ncbi:unnamed protein product [Dimorphilus gyrociliatus]|uniref:Multiple inositol polyphosphate phosphatase 1 n=1 Tax=Dimorphilus gyrociliatus TaxID=2664684 RepID=A0A7I8W9D5_9ANNE|nr:unnamed protein product [Dimorphilus gyrociliatus]
MSAKDIIILSIFLTVLIERSFEYCSTEEKSNRHYGTYTSYDNSFEESQLTNLNSNVTMIYFIGRHGSRQESGSGIRNWRKYLPELQEILEKNQLAVDVCREDIESIINWKLNISIKDSYKLLEIGKNEQKSIAKRLLIKFPRFFNNLRNVEQLDFQSSNTDRTYQSAYEFLSTIFKGRNISFNIKRSRKSDNLIRSYKNFDPSYTKRSEKIQLKIENFLKSDEIQEILKSIPMVTNLNLDFHPQLLLTIWRSCAYEYLSLESSPWCAVFNDKVLKILEFLDDARYYNLQGYGLSPAQKSACVIIRDVWENIHLSKAGMYLLL